MSGYGIATIIVEATETSGTRIQARVAVQHGRPVILTSAVVNANKWAQALEERPNVYVAHNTDELEHLITQLEREDRLMRDMQRDLLVSMDFGY